MPLASVKEAGGPPGWLPRWPQAFGGTGLPTPDNCPSSRRLLSRLPNIGDQALGGVGRRSRVLAGDQQAVLHDIAFPVRATGIEAALGLEFVLHQERHHLDQAHSRFLGVGEAGDLPALNQRSALSVLDVAKLSFG